MKTSILFIAGLLACSVAIAQNKIIGKWKPVFFNLGNIITADIKADTFYLSQTVDSVFKDDKDPEASKEAMKFLAGIMLQKMKSTEQEFLASGEYIETDTNSNTTKKGTYTFDAATNLLSTTVRNKTNKFMVSFRGDKLILTGDLESRNGKKGSLIIEHEKL
jgi:hypothetical protein